MIRKAGLVTLLAAMAAFLGCDGWKSGGGALTWDDSYGFANFNGLYRGVDNPIVFAFSKASTVPSSTNNVSTNSVTQNLENNFHVLATGNGSKTVFSSNLGGDFLLPVVVRGSLTIVAGGLTFTDNNGVLTAQDGSSGTVVYETGAWTLNFAAAPANGVDIVAKYTYQVTTLSNSGGTSTSSGGSVESTAEMGSTIHTFNIRHLGNLVTITDSNGDVYEGNIDGLDYQRSGINSAVADGPVVATFTAQGTSRGVGVRIVGSLQGRIVGPKLSNRIVQGTWIQDNNRTGDILGEASDIELSAQDLAEKAAAAAATNRPTTGPVGIPITIAIP